MSHVHHGLTGEFSWWHYKWSHPLPAPCLQRNNIRSWEQINLQNVSILYKKQEKYEKKCQIDCHINFMLLSRFSRVRLCATPGKNTGVGCHFLLQCMKGKGESEVTQSCSTLSDPMDCSLPGSSGHGIFQARVLEWGASNLYLGQEIKQCSYMKSTSSTTCSFLRAVQLHPLQR